MANTDCVTVGELVKAVPSLLTFGGPASGSIEFVNETGADQIAIAGVTATGTPGPRAPGSNTWSTDGTAVAEIVSLVEMLNDGGASFAAILDAIVPTPGVAKAFLTTIGTGVAANLAWATDNPADIILDPLDAMSGGQIQLEFAIACACSMINRECWGVKTKCASTYLAAHLIAVGAGEGGGIVNRKKIDKIEVGYAVASFDPSDAAFASTKWGRLYLALRSTLFIPPLVGRCVLPVVC